MSGNSEPGIIASTLFDPCDTQVRKILWFLASHRGIEVQIETHSYKVMGHRCTYQ